MRRIVEKCRSRCGVPKKEYKMARRRSWRRRGKRMLYGRRSRALRRRMRRVTRRSGLRRYGGILR